MLNWIATKEQTPPSGVPIWFWSGEWVDPAFNPEGIREGFYLDGVYTSCDWNSCPDMYVTDAKSTPTMWASRCPPCPKELLAYTQLREAIKRDFGVELSPKPGEEIVKVIDDILRVAPPIRCWKRWLRLWSLWRNS